MRLGAYELERKLGDGAAGVVWRARLGHDAVAIKLLHRGVAEEFASSLTREVHAVAALDHPNIVTVIDFDHVRSDEATDQFEAGQPYVVFEYGARGALDEYLNSGPTLSWPWVRNLLMGTLDALAHAHARDFIHRDLKPGNMIGFDRPAAWKLADFGLAFLRGEADRHKVFGTPQFMAPEQFYGRAYLFGPQTDLYALGCMAYLLICGRLPYSGPNTLVLANAHLTTPVPDLTPNFGVPEGLDAWVKTLLAKNPVDRFEQAADAAAALAALPSVGDDSRISSEMMEPMIDTVALSLMGTQLSEEATADFGEGRPGQPEPLGARPPVASQPPTWRKSSLATRNTLAALSPRLFALRSHDLIARDTELDRLWTALVWVRRQKMIKSVVITGPEGVGKTHLARWFGQRSSETGAANTFVLGEDAWRSILRHARLDNFPEARQTELLASLAEELGVVELKQTQETRGDGHLALISYLIALSERRPVVLLIDDIQSHPIAPKIVQDLTRLHLTINAPILIVATQGPVVGDAHRERWMKRADEIVLSNLTDTATMELIESRLKLAPRSAERVMNASAGNPRIVVEILAQWVEGAHLTPTSIGLEADLDAPMGVGSWRLAIEKILANPTYRDCLRWAAALGREVHWIDWSWLCREAGLVIPNELVATLVRSGLARWTDEGFEFSNGLIPDAIDHKALVWVAAERLSELQRVHPSPARWELIGELYFTAGDYARCIEPLRQGASWRRKSTALMRNRQLLAMLWDATKKLGDEHATAIAKLKYLEIANEFAPLNPSDWVAMADEAKRKGWPDVQSESLVCLANHYGRNNQFECSLPYTQEALKILQEAGLPTLKVERNYADVLAYTDRLSESLRLYQSCMEQYVKENDAEGIAWCHYGIGYVQQQWGNQQVALTHLRRAAQWYRKDGDLSNAAAVDNSIGDCLFILGRYEEARKFATAAAQQFNRQGRHIPEAYGNLALIALALDEIGEFKRNANLVVRYGYDASHFWGIIAGLAALEHDWEKWDGFVSRIAHGTWDRHVDFANALAALVKCTRIAGDPTRAAIIEETEREYRAMLNSRRRTRHT